MTANQMLQVMPAINQIHGWGNAKDQQIAIKEGFTGGRVISFTVTKEESERTGAGYQLTLTRIANSDNLWSMATHYEGGEVYLIDTNK